MQVNDEVVISGGSWSGHQGTVVVIRPAGVDKRGQERASVLVQIEVPGGADRSFHFKPSQLRVSEDLERLGNVVLGEEPEDTDRGILSAADVIAQFGQVEDRVRG